MDDARALATYIRRDRGSRSHHSAGLGEIASIHPSGKRFSKYSLIQGGSCRVRVRRGLRRAEEELWSASQFDAIDMVLRASLEVGRVVVYHRSISKSES